MSENSKFLQEEINALYKISRFIDSMTNLDQLLNIIIKESKRVVDAEACSLLLYDQDADDLYFEIALGKKGEQIKKIRLKLGQGIAGVVAKRRKSMNVSDVKKEKFWDPSADKASGFKSRSLLAVPMIRKENLVGIIEVVNKRGEKHFTDEDVRIVEILAEQAALCIENARLYEENLRTAKMAAVGGIYHKTALYYSFLTELAKVEGRIIVAIDSPGVGGSTLANDNTVRANMFIDAIVQAAKSTDLAGRHIDLVGHSLGTIAVKQAYFSQDDLAKHGIHIDKFVAANMAPSVRERSMGYDLAGEWVIKSMGNLVANCFKTIEPKAYDLFFQNHPADERKWLITVVSKESYPASIVSFFSIFNSINELNVMEILEKGDSNFRLLIAENDELMPIDNLRNWDRRGIIILPNADHSSIAGKKSTHKFVKYFQRALNEPVHTEKPPFSQMQAYLNNRSLGFFRTAYAIGGDASMHSVTSAGVEWRAGIIPGLYASIGANLNFETDFQDEYDPNFIIEQRLGIDFLDYRTILNLVLREKFLLGYPKETDEIPEIRMGLACQWNFLGLDLYSEVSTPVTKLHNPKFENLTFLLGLGWMK